MVFTTILANLLATGCALLLVHRGPSRRLKLLAFTVGLMSLSQTAALLHTVGIWSVPAVGVARLHELLVAGLALQAIYLLGQEVYEQNYKDRKLRLIEFDFMRPLGIIGGHKEKETAERPEAAGMMGAQALWSQEACK
ncbi:MAG: hypothetical protein IANPNBLG_00430 [Bryobacteraceae bacterium]|nr:hypothetical protein [Bryobacteraceae bacterium]MCC6342581.1 hypothetical protein [Bryobacterales bacterium]